VNRLYHQSTPLATALATGFFLGMLAIPLAADAAPARADLDAIAERAMAEFRVPGVTVSVVQGGEVRYAAGLGVLEAGQRKRVDDDTLFQIGSVSKAFTAAALAVLADDGKLSFDDRVIDHLPEFRMYDPWVTREFTIRDLLTHRSGLPLGAGDLLIFPEAQSTRDEVVRAMRHFEPSSSFRSKFDYDNLLYIVAGEVVARVSGLSFDDFLEQRLLAPLGMQDCSATLERAAEDAKKATPHVLVEDELQTTRSGITEVAAAAGGINCSANGMARWMQFVLGRGQAPGGERLISEAQFAQLTQPVTLLSTPGYLAEHAGAHLSAYALGWNVHDFHGQPALSHGGGVWGMTTFLLVMPDADLAVFASGNQLSAAPRAVVYDVAEAFLGTPPAAADSGPGPDWIAVIAELTRSRRESGQDVVEQAAAERAADSRPSLPLEAYAGTYRDPWYGDVEIRLQDDGRLWFHSGRSAPLTGPLEHFQFDTFIVRWTDRRLNADAYLTFSLTPQGAVDRIRMKAVSPNTDFSYDFHDLDLQRVD
jgi:CubicO group peptidase (beta-lactamase class C family)